VEAKLLAVRAAARHQLAAEFEQLRVDNQRRRARVDQLAGQIEQLRRRPSGRPLRSPRAHHSAAPETAGVDVTLVDDSMYLLKGPERDLQHLTVAQP
jgi:hypothetical protein